MMFEGLLLPCMVGSHGEELLCGTNYVGEEGNTHAQSTSSESGCKAGLSVDV